MRNNKLSLQENIEDSACLLYYLQVFRLLNLSSEILRTITEPPSRKVIFFFLNENRRTERNTRKQAR